MLDTSTHISVEAKDYLVDWYTTKPVFALMGEYSAGKSTLLNLLLDQNALPTKVTATNLPPVWLTYSDEPTCQGLRFDGTLEDVDLNETSDDVRDLYVVLRMGVTSDRLKTADIIDTPGISDPKLEKGALNFLGDYMDFTLWLSAANQAWRQTEKMAWTAFPDALRTDSILLLTRADKLRNAKDLAKVQKRCTTETADLFRDIVPLMTTKAAAIDHADRTDEEDGAWVTTGGAALENALKLSFENAIKARRAADVVHVPKIKKAPAPAAAQEISAKDAAPAETVDLGTDEAIEQTSDQTQPSQSQKETPNPQSTIGAPRKDKTMSTDISELNKIAGFIGACLVDSETGLMMASEGGGERLDLEAAGAANTEVVKAKLAAIEMLGLDEQIDDILITLGGQFHLIRPLEDTPTVFIYTALDKKTANLGMARVQVKKVEKTVSL